MDIAFRKITDFPRGTLCALLREGYCFEPRFERDCFRQWQEFDDFLYNNSYIAEVSGFVTVYDGVPIGFVSWDPINIPVSAEVGYNCIIGKYRGNGYGRRQMQEAVKRIAAQGAERIFAATDEILIPSRRTYESAGFKCIGKSEEQGGAEYAGMRIYYEIDVTDMS